MLTCITSGDIMSVVDRLVDCGSGYYTGRVSYSEGKPFNYDRYDQTHEAGEWLQDEYILGRQLGAILCCHGIQPHMFADAELFEILRDFLHRRAHYAFDLLGHSPIGTTQKGSIYVR